LFLIYDVNGRDNITHRTIIKLNFDITVL